MALVDSIVKGVIALTVLFLLMATIVLPQFANTYNYCQNPAWKPDNSSDGTYTNCSSRVQDAYNSTPTPSDYPITEDTTDDHLNYTKLCLNCDTAGAYRTTIQGLAVLLIVIGVIGFAVYFLRRK